MRLSRFRKQPAPRYVSEHPEAPSDPAVAMIELGEHTVAYTDEGPHDGPVVVAVPGLPGRVRDFRWLAPTLNDAVRVVRLELPGYGDSPRTRWVGMDNRDRAGVVAALIDALELGAVTLLGHSAGCVASAQVASERPELVSSLAFLGSPGLEPHYPVRVYRTVGRALEGRHAARLLAPAIRRLYSAAGFPAYLSDDERRATMLDAAVQDFAAHGATVRRLTCPTLVAWAADDRLIPDALSETLASVAPDGPRLRFEEGGHNIQKTRAKPIGEAVRDLVGL